MHNKHTSYVAVTPASNAAAAGVASLNVTQIIPPLVSSYRWFYICRRRA
jgi:hypothetical protein